MKYGVATVLPNAVREELGAAALVLIAAHASLRWELSGEVSATDATPCMEGATRARAPAALVSKMYIAAEHRGEYTRLDWGLSA